MHASFILLGRTHDQLESAFHCAEALSSILCFPFALDKGSMHFWSIIDNQVLCLLLFSFPHVSCI